MSQKEVFAFGVDACALDGGIEPCPANFKAVIVGDDGEIASLTDDAIALKTDDSEGEAGAGTLVFEGRGDKLFHVCERSRLVDRHVGPD